MSAWEIYLIMQVDSISGALVAFFIMFGLASLAMLMIGFFENDYHGNRVGDVWFNRAKKVAIAMNCIMVVNVFIPSSKTLATMIVLPAVVNNEQVQGEAKELYGLAKQALTDLAKSAAPKTTDKK